MQLGQIAIEYLTLMGIGFVMLTFFLVVASDRLADLNKDALAVEAQDIAFMVQSEIVNAATVEDGFARNFTIPQKLAKSDFSIAIIWNQQTNRTTLTVDADTVHIAMPSPNVNGTVVKGNNQLRKINGVVYVNINP